jgi:hypothetical protein
MATALVSTRTTVATICNLLSSPSGKLVPDLPRLNRLNREHLVRLHLLHPLRKLHIIRLYSRPARTWSHFHIVSVMVFPPSNRLSSRFSSQNVSAYLSSPLLLVTATHLSGDRRTLHANRYNPGDKKEGHPSRNAPHLYYVKIYPYGLHLFLFINVDVLSIDHAFVLLRLLVRFGRACSTIGRR